MRTDFLLDEKGDLQIEDGDFVTGEADDQHVELLLTTIKGQNKQFPTLGAELPIELDNILSPRVSRNIKLSMVADGYKATRITNSTGKISVEYVRES